MKLPERIQTARLILRRPLAADADAIFEGWAADERVTRLMAWPRHHSIDDTRAFLAFSDEEWERWPAGPYVIELQGSDELVGSCGFAFRDEHTAEVGYICARRFWGRGYATECLAAQVAVAAALAPIALEAHIHAENRPSRRVLEKCGFIRDDAEPVTADFPNLHMPGPGPAVRYVRVLDPGSTL